MASKNQRTRKIVKLGVWTAALACLGLVPALALGEPHEPVPVAPAAEHPPGVTDAGRAEPVAECVTLGEISRRAADNPLLFEEQLRAFVSGVPGCASVTDETLLLPDACFRSIFGVIDGSTSPDAKRLAAVFQTVGATPRCAAQERRLAPLEETLVTTGTLQSLVPGWLECTRKTEPSSLDALIQRVEKEGAAYGKLCGPHTASFVPGTYTAGSPPWKEASRLILTWCENAGSATDCVHIRADLGKPPITSYSYPPCIGSLTVEATTARFASWECNGGSYAQFKKEGGVYVLENAWFEDGGD